MGKFFSVMRWIMSLCEYCKKTRDYRYAPNYSKKNIKNVCILLDKGMGDYILFSYYLGKIYDYFSKNMNVLIIANPYNFEFIKAFNPELMEKILLLKEDEENVNEDILAKYRGYFDLMLVSAYVVMPRHFKIIRQLSPGKIYAMRDKMLKTGYTVLDYAVLKYIDYYNIKENFYPNMHRDFFKKITGMDYGIKIKKPNVVEMVPGEYFVVNLTTSKMNKYQEMPLTKILSITNKLTQYYNMKAILLGDVLADKIGCISGDNVEFSYINMRDMQKTIDICANARFILTHNTGIMHLGISLSKKVFVINKGEYEIQFENYPKYLLNEKLFFIKKYNTCDECPCPKSWCKLTRKIFHKRLYCISRLKESDVIDYIIDRNT